MGHKYSKRKVRRTQHDCTQSMLRVWKNDWASKVKPSCGARLSVQQDYDVLLYKGEQSPNPCRAFPRRELKQHGNASANKIHSIPVRDRGSSERKAWSFKREKLRAMFQSCPVRTYELIEVQLRRILNKVHAEKMMLKLTLTYYFDKLSKPPKSNESALQRVQKYMLHIQDVQNLLKPCWAFINVSKVLCLF